jgi:hypothetical protein
MTKLKLIGLALLLSMAGCAAWPQIEKARLRSASLAVARDIGYDESRVLGDAFDCIDAVFLLLSCNYYVMFVVPQGALQIDANLSAWYPDTFASGSDFNLRGLESRIRSLYTYGSSTLARSDLLFDTTLRCTFCKERRIAASGREMWIAIWESPEAFNRLPWRRPDDPERISVIAITARRNP